MKIAPHEILYHLGFHVPPEGIEIHPNDVHLHAESLRALGSTIDVASIPASALSNLYVESLRLLSTAIDISSIQESELRELHTGLASLVETCRGGVREADPQPDTSVADWLRALIASNLAVMYKQYGRRYGSGSTPLQTENEPDLGTQYLPDLSLICT